MAKKKSRNLLRKALLDSIRAKKALFSKSVFDSILCAAEKIVEAYRKGNKVLLYGNGGSASDSLHIAGELLGRFGHQIERPALPAISLAENPSAITAISNDYGYLDSFARQLDGLGCPGDVAIGISTSGNSPNVLEATRLARKKGLFTIGLTGGSGGKLKQLAHLSMCVPVNNTQRIQESHITIGHALCELVEKALYG
ncbi:MAG: SIS domain-containing protein [Candidatus Omnitrophota bacterium]